MKEESLITKILKRKDIALLAIVAILCLLLFRQCDSNLDLKSQIKIQNMNLDALKDTVRVQNNKAGEVVWEGFVMKALDDGKYPFITNPNYCSPAWQKQRIRW